MCIRDSAGAEFEVYAAEDIYTADHQVDADGQRTLYFAKDALVATVTTDTDGYATVKNLPLGRYYVKEKNAPDTYVLNTVPENVEFAYADQDTAVIEKEISVTDERQKVSITVEKQEMCIRDRPYGLHTTTGMSMRHPKEP